MDLIIASKPEVIKEGMVHQFVGLELALVVSRQNIKETIGNQCMTMWQCLTNTQRQARELSRMLDMLLRIGYCPLLGCKPR